MGVKKILKIAINFLFPPHCIFCDRTMELNSTRCVCPECSGQVSYCSELLCCEKCGKTVVSYGQQKLCVFCLETFPLYFDRIVSVFPYVSPVSDAVQRYKGLNLQSNASGFAEYIAERIEEEYKNTSFDFLCCVPSSSDKRRERGFDSVELIAQRVSGITGIPMKRKVLKKVRKTKKQTELKYHERLENLRGSMAVCENVSVEGKTVLLVDDVCTTRATIIECSRALKAAGAKRVFAVTLGTTENRYNG
ncbi:MAG: ComF family protein [Clostridia bacterium]|nr:ComF family protein [Clostridia bacterium]